MWKDALEGCEYDCFFHTWDTREIINKTWWRQYIIDPPKLESSHIDILKKWDPNVVIESQHFTSEDHNKTFGTSYTPQKVLVYMIHSLLSTLKRINKDNYDMIIVGRYDITLSSHVRFKDITVTPGELELAARVCSVMLGGFAVTSELFAFHSSDLDKFYNPLDNTDFTKYAASEECFTEMYLKIFNKVNHRWLYEKDFCLSRYSAQK
jgi:hypothetical protein